MTTLYLLLGADDASLSELAGVLFPEADPQILVRRLPGNPIAALEVLPEELAANELTLGRLIALVDVAELEKRPELKAWGSALAHFADVLLLANTKEVSPAWLGAFKKSLKDRPLEIFDWPQALKKNPGSVIAEITFPEARRLSQHFEADAITTATPLYIGEGNDDHNDPDDLSPEDLDAAAQAAEEADEIPLDPYFERDAAGRYVIKVKAP